MTILSSQAAFPRLQASTRGRHDYYRWWPGRGGSPVARMAGRLRGVAAGGGRGPWCRRSRHGDRRGSGRQCGCVRVGDQGVQAEPGKVMAHLVAVGGAKRVVHLTRRLRWVNPGALWPTDRAPSSAMTRGSPNRRAEDLLPSVVTDVSVTCSTAGHAYNLPEPSTPGGSTLQAASTSTILATSTLLVAMRARRAASECPERIFEVTLEVP